MFEQTCITVAVIVNEQIFLDTLRALLDIPIQKINAILNDLCEIYPRHIKKHYRDFLERCETVCAEFLAQNKIK